MGYYWGGKWHETPEPTERIAARAAARARETGRTVTISTGSRSVTATPSGRVRVSSGGGSSPSGGSSGISQKPKATAQDQQAKVSEKPKPQQPEQKQYVSREFIEKATGRKYRGLKEKVPLWQAKAILKQEGVEYKEEGGRLTVEKQTKQERLSSPTGEELRRIHRATYATEKPTDRLAKSYQAAVEAQKKQAEQKRVAEGERIKQEIESRGVPIIPREKVDVEEKALLKVLKVSEKVKGDGTGVIAGVRQAGAEIIAGIGVTGYAAVQLAKRPKETARYVISDPAGIAKGTAREFVEWGREFKEMPTKKKVGYVIGFVGIPTAVGKGVGAARGVRVKGGKVVYKGEVVTGGLIKQKVKGRLRTAEVEAVDVAPTGEAKLRGERPGYVKDVRTIEGEGIKVQIETREPATKTELHYPMEAEVRSYRRGEYTERRTGEHLVATKEGEVRPMVRERRIREEKVEMPLTEEKLVATVEERRTIPDVPGERMKVIHEVGIVKAKRGGLTERQRMKTKETLKPVIITSERAVFKLPKPRLLPRIGLKPVQKKAAEHKQEHQELLAEIPRARQLSRTSFAQKLSRFGSLLIREERTETRERQGTVTFQAKALAGAKETSPMLPVIPLGRSIKLRPLKARKKQKKSEGPKSRLLRGGRRHRIKDVWRIGVKAEKLKKMLFGR